MPDAINPLQLLVGALLAYVGLCVAHAVLGVLLRLIDDIIRFLMRVFHVKRGRRR